VPPKHVGEDGTPSAGFHPFDRIDEYFPALLDVHRPGPMVNRLDLALGDHMPPALRRNSDGEPPGGSLNRGLIIRTLAGATLRRTNGAALRPIPKARCKGLSAI